MILSCPACQAQYVIPDGSIAGAGRTVKCTKCSHKWHQDPIEDEVIHVEAEIFDPIEEQNNESSIDDDQSHHVYENEVSHTDKSVDNDITLQSVAFSFLVFFALFFSVLLTGRHYFVQQWEPLAAFYDLVHLPVPVPGEGLALENVSAEVIDDKGETVLIVKGRIDNQADFDVALPFLKISSHLDNLWLKDWVIPLGGKIMQPKQSVAFDYRLTDLPSDHDNVTITFSYK